MKVGINLTKIYCKHIHKYHIVSPIQLLDANKKESGPDGRKCHWRMSLKGIYHPWPGPSFLSLWLLSTMR
jgi:hypothetical protein